LAWEPFWVLTTPQIGNKTTLTHRPENDKAITACPVWDITEAKPIPKGTEVLIVDWDSCGGDRGMWIVEYHDRIYLAEPYELRL
jgi:hypothetical protein